MAVFVPLLVMGLPIVDTLLAMVRRIWRGQSPFQADKEHVHHRLMAKGLSHRGAVLAMYGITGLLCVAAVTSTLLKGTAVVALLGTALAVLLIFLARLGYFNIRGARTNQELRKRNQNLRQAVRAARDRLANASQPQELWRAMTGLFPDLGADDIELQLKDWQGDDGQRREFDFVWNGPGGPSGAEGLAPTGRQFAFERRFALGKDSLICGEMVVRWSIGTEHAQLAIRDAEIACERLAQALDGRLSVLFPPGEPGQVLELQSRP